MPAMNIETSRDIGALGVLYLARFGDDPRRRIEFVDTIEPGIARERKWVLMVSTQFGCPIGCLLCDAGALGFEGNLSAEQILEQIEYVFQARPELSVTDHPKLKIHFARMGEPSLNPDVPRALELLAQRHPGKGVMPSLSSVAPRGKKVDAFFEEILRVKDERYPLGRFQMQFSLHGTRDEDRNRVVPVPKWSLREIAAYGDRFVREGDRKVTLNFALTPGARLDDAVIAGEFSPGKFLIKFTPVNPTSRARASGTSNPWFDVPEALVLDADRLRARGFEVIASPSQSEEIEAATSCGQLWSSVMRRKIQAVRSAKQAPPAAADAGKTEFWMAETARFERRTFTLNPAKAGLLVVDMQRQFLDAGSRSYIPAAAGILGNVSRLIEAFRAIGSEPFFTRHSYLSPEHDGGRMLEWWRSVCLETGEGAKLPSEFLAQADRNFRKTRYNAFTNKRLEPALHAAGIEDLVIVGAATNLCVESTARAAFDLGFRVFTAADATAARHEELHVGSLRSMAHGFACVSTTAALEADLKRLESSLS